MIADIPTGSTWQNRRTGKLVTVIRRDLQLDEVTVRHAGGSERTSPTDAFVKRFRPESEIPP